MTEEQLTYEPVQKAKELPQSSVVELVQGIRPNYIEHLSSNPWIAEFLNALAKHSFWTYEHSLRVGFIHGRLVEEFVNPRPEHVLLQVRAASLHDIGKLDVPTSVLDDPKPLTDRQRAQIDIHPRTGFERLATIDPEAAKIVVSHHEFQPRSFPRHTARKYDTWKLKERKLVALADQIDALRSKRPYKTGWSREETLAGLRKFFPAGQIDLALDLYDQVSL